MKILLFWFGYQGKKYYTYLKNKYWFSFDIITKSGKVDVLVKQDDKVYKYNEEEIIRKLSKYDVIIVAVSPLSEQEKILNMLLKVNINAKVLVEKPVVEDLKYLKDLVYRKNFYFFCDEIVNWKYIKDIFDKYNKSNTFVFQKKIFFIPNLEYHIFEHAICNFLYLNKTWLENLLNDLSLKSEPFNKFLLWRKIFYKIIVGNLIFINLGGRLLIKAGNNYWIKKINFYEAVDFYLFKLTDKDNFIFKNNYFVFRAFIDKYKVIKI